MSYFMYGDMSFYTDIVLLMRLLDSPIISELFGVWNLLLFGDSNNFDVVREKLFILTALDLESITERFERASSDFISTAFLITSSSKSSIHLTMCSSTFSVNGVFSLMISTKGN